MSVTAVVIISHGNHINSLGYWCTVMPHLIFFATRTCHCMGTIKLQRAWLQLRHFDEGTIIPPMPILTGFLGLNFSFFFWRGALLSCITLSQKGEVRLIAWNSWSQTKYLFPGALLPPPPLPAVRPNFPCFHREDFTVQKIKCLHKLRVCLHQLTPWQIKRRWLSFSFAFLAFTRLPSHMTSHLHLLHVLLFLLLSLLLFKVGDRNWLGGGLWTYPGGAGGQSSNLLSPYSWSDPKSPLNLPSRWLG